MFADRILAAADRKRSFLVVGIDPALERLPRPLLRAAEEAGGDLWEVAERALTQFGVALIEATAAYAVAVKPQLAYFERYGWRGLRALERIMRAAKEAGLLVIADGKRNDIGPTAEAYADAYLGDGPLAADALTVNPYLGRDGIEPFVARCTERGRGVFVLVKTSNPSSGEVQDLPVDGKPLYVRMGEAVRRWNRAVGERGYGCVGAVVGATYPAQLAELRALMPETLFLVPGFGAQGGTAEDVVGAFDPKTGYGGLVNASRAIMYAYEGADLPAERYAEAQSEAARAARDAINAALAKAGRLPVPFV